MSQPFDPYYRWLGIPAGEQPPNRYRLLGIQCFEDNPDVIETAADQRMGHLRKYQAGEHSALSQQLLNEVAAARICLLNAAKKADYDEKLRAQLPPTEPPRVSNTVAETETKPVVALPSIDVSGAGKPKRHGNKKRLVHTIAAVCVGVLAVGALLLMMATRNGQSSKQVAEKDADEQITHTEPRVKEVLEDDVGPLDHGDDGHGGQHGEIEAEEWSSEEAVADQAEPSPEELPATPDEDETLDPNRTVPAEQKLTQEQPPAAGGERAAVPPDGARTQARGIVRELYRDDYDTAKTPAERQAFAKKLRQLAVDTSGDAAAAYVLFEEALDIATEVGDGQTAFQVIDEMAGAFQINAAAKKTTALKTFARRARLPVQHQEVVQKASTLMSQAVAADDFSTAKSLGEIATESAHEARAHAVAKQIRDRVNRIGRLTAGYDQLANHRSTLRTNPQDPQANLNVGKFYCFQKGEWDKGLPMIQMGTDASLKQLAEMDLNQNTTPSERVKVGDGWWNLAQQDEQPAKELLEQRAAHWYARAVPELTGLAKATAEKRLNSIYREPVFALALNGTSDLGRVSLFRYDGSHPITIEAVVLPMTLGRVQRVFGNWELAGLGVAIEKSGKWQFDIREGHQWRTATSTLPSGLNLWVHVAAVFDGHNVGLFVNGVLQPARAILQTKHSHGSMDFVVGANPERHRGHLEFFHGLIDEIRVSNTVKYVKNFKPERRLANEGDTILLLHFDEGSGTKAYDYSGKGYHCTLRGAQWMDLRRWTAVDGQEGSFTVP